MPNASLPKNLPSDFAAAFTAIMALDRLDIEDMKLMVLLEAAGEPLYQRLADLTSDPEAKELLLKNGREETAHAQRLKRSIEILTSELYEIPPLANNPYAEPPAFEALSVDLLQGVAAAENSGDALYQKYAGCEANGEVADLLRQNGREETGHGERVSRVIEILRAAGAG